MSSNSLKPFFQIEKGCAALPQDKEEPHKTDTIHEQQHAQQVMVSQVPVNQGLEVRNEAITTTAASDLRRHRSGSGESASSKDSEDPRSSSHESLFSNDLGSGEGDGMTTQGTHYMLSKEETSKDALKKKKTTTNSDFHDNTGRLLNVIAAPKVLN